MSTPFILNPENYSMHYEGEYSVGKNYFKGAVVRSIGDTHLYLLTSDFLEAKAEVFEPGFSSVEGGGWGPNWSNENIWNGVNSPYNPPIELANYTVEPGQAAFTYGPTGIKLTDFGTTKGRLRVIPEAPSNSYEVLMRFSYDLPGNTAFTTDFTPRIIGFFFILMNTNPDSDLAGPEVDVDLRGDEFGAVTSHLNLWVYGYDEVFTLDTASSPIVMTNGVEYYVRVRANNPFFAAKVWAAADPEPVDWSVSHTFGSPISLANPFTVEQPGPVTYTIVSTVREAPPNQVFRVYEIKIISPAGVDYRPEDDTSNWLKLGV